MRKTYQLGVRVNDIRDAFSRESLLPEPPLDIVEYFRVRWISLIQDVPELEIRRAETVAEVLRENPAAVYWNKSELWVGESEVNKSYKHTWLLALRDCPPYLWARRRGCLGDSTAMTPPSSLGRSSARWEVHGSPGEGSDTTK